MTSPPPPFIALTRSTTTEMTEMLLPVSPGILCFEIANQIIVPERARFGSAIEAALGKEIGTIRIETPLLFADGEGCITIDTRELLDVDRMGSTHELAIS